MIAGGFSGRSPRFTPLDRWMTRFRSHDTCALAALPSRKFTASGSSCVANAYTSNHDRTASGQVGAFKGFALHVVDAVGIVHAMLLRIQALLLPVKTLALSKPPRTVESVPTPRVYGIGFDRRCRLSAER